MFEKLALGLFILLLGTNLFGNGNSWESYDCKLLQSYIEGDLSEWPVWIQEIERNENGDLKWELIKHKAQYGLIGYYFGTRQKDKARNLLQQADDQLNENLEEYPNSPKLHSFKAAFYAFKIGLAIYKAPILGPKMASSIQQAFDIDENEPMGWLEMGNSLYNRPALFGGDKLEALECFKKSLQLFSNQSEACDYLSVQVKIFIVKAYLETGQTKEYQQARKELEDEYGAMPWIDEFLQVDLLE
ncbi:hypothetical protein ACUNWD_19980 [Sunxiuqinia sp. A32]|uniref:hypothetical protein n=1 Tax=Sunxiuqinia sp. A32 TaxID=3461496 RepID=UPI00404641D7